MPRIKTTSESGIHKSLVWRPTGIPSLGSLTPSSLPFFFYIHQIGNNFGYFLHMVFIANLTSVSKPMSKTKELHFMSFGGTKLQIALEVWFCFVLFCFASSDSKFDELFEVSM